MKIGDGFNEYGTPITYFQCEYCGREFWVCPAVDDDNLDSWTGCLDVDCESYTPSRDAELMIFFGIPIEKRPISDG